MREWILTSCLLDYFNEFKEKRGKTSMKKVVLIGAGEVGEMALSCMGA